MHRQLGFSLIEVTLASSLLAVFSVIALSAMSSMSDATALANAIRHQKLQMGDAIEAMTENLSDAMILNLPGAGANEITFIVPVDWDNDGDVFDGSMNVEWGYLRDDISPGGFLDLSHVDPGSDAVFTMTYRFVKTEVFFDEAVQAQDFNNDGDTADIFDMGRIELVFSQGTPSTGGNPVAEFVIAVTDEDVIVVRNQTNADIDGDGQADKAIFWQSGASLHLEIYQRGATEDIKNTFVKTVTDVPLFNFSAMQ